MTQRSLKRFNLPNERGLRSHCDICGIKFQLLVKQEHQCKRCLRPVCEQCGPERRVVYEGDGSSSLHRCCTVCLKEIEIIMEYRTQSKLCFGQDSCFVSDWVNRLNKERRSYDDILNEFSENNLTGATNQNTIRFKREFDAIYNELLDSYNYSLRNFIKIITEDVSEQIIKSKLRNVMIAVYARVRTLPFIPELIYLVIFFLCFANEAHTYYIITRMIEKIYPQYVRVNKMKKDNLLNSTLKTILEMYRICVDRVDRNELEVMSQYLEARFSNYVLSFTLNICSMPASFFIINEMLNTGSYLPFYKGIASMLFTCREDVASYKAFSEVEIPILRTFNIEKIKAAFIEFERSDARFEVSNEVFDSAEHRKLHEKHKSMVVEYEKSQMRLKEQENKIEKYEKELQLKKKSQEEQVAKTKELQIQFLSLANTVPKVMKFNEISKRLEETGKRNEELEQKCFELEKSIEKLEKEKIGEEKYKRSWAKMEEDYMKEIVDLKTRNEILEIQVSAKEIDFNTSFIDRKFKTKNDEINILKEEIKHLKTDLDYYKLKILQNSYTFKPNTQPKTNDKEKLNEVDFETHIRNSKELVQTLEAELKEMKDKYQVKIAEMEELVADKKVLQDKVKETEEISKIIYQIPEEHSYLESIEQLKRAIDKETNFLKKQSLESVKENFFKCHRELKFRAIDSQLKETKIKNLLTFQTKTTNLSNLPLEANQGGLQYDPLLRTLIQNARSGGTDNNGNKECKIM